MINFFYNTNKYKSLTTSISLTVDFIKKSLSSIYFVVVRNLFYIKLYSFI